MDVKKQDQSQKKYNKYNFTKIILQFVISVSVFSFFVWYSSGFSILPQSFNAYFCTCFFSMLTRTLERKYMFLICNAILALLAKSLVLTSSSPFDDIDLQPSNTTKAQQVYEETVFPLGSFQFLENAPLVVEAEEGTEQVKKQEKYSEDEGEEEHGTGTLLSENERRVNEDSVVEEELELVVAGKDEGETGSSVMVTQNDELTDTTLMATNEEVASTEELNRKFEEFIRKMKEEMRIEAQSQPIAV